MITSDQRIRFMKIFDMNIKHFIDQLGGFDVIEFDVWIDPDDDQSTIAVVLEKFGQQGVDMVKELIKDGFFFTKSL